MIVNGAICVDRDTDLGCDFETGLARIMLIQDTQHDEQLLHSDVCVSGAVHQKHTPQVQISLCQTPTTHTKHHK